MDENRTIPVKDGYLLNRSFMVTSRTQYIPVAADRRLPYASPPRHATAAQYHPTGPALASNGLTTLLRYSELHRTHWPGACQCL